MYSSNLREGFQGTTWCDFTCFPLSKGTLGRWGVAGEGGGDDLVEVGPKWKTVDCKWGSFSKQLKNGLQNTVVNINHVRTTPTLSASNSTPTFIYDINSFA